MEIELKVLKNKDAVQADYAKPIEIEGYLVQPIPVLLNRHLADCLEGFTHIIKEFALLKKK